MNKIIVKDNTQFTAFETKDIPSYIKNLKEWERSQKITKIHYNVGDDCVFEITRGNKKWTIQLDKFFDKVIEIVGKQR